VWRFIFVIVFNIPTSISACNDSHSSQATATLGNTPNLNIGSYDGKHYIWFPNQGNPTHLSNVMRRNTITEADYFITHITNKKKLMPKSYKMRYHCQVLLDLNKHVIKSVIDSAFYLDSTNLGIGALLRSTVINVMC